MCWDLIEELIEIDMEMENKIKRVVDNAMRAGTHRDIGLEYVKNFEQILEDIKFYRPVDINLLKDLSAVQKNSNNMLGYHLTNSEFLFYSGRYEEALRDLQEARRIARNNFKIREIITERILILQTYVQPNRRRN